MKKFIFSIITMTFVLILNGCSGTPVPYEREENIEINGVVFATSTFEYNNHKYIVFGDIRSHCKIVHDPDCPCNNKK